MRARAVSARAPRAPKNNPPALQGYCIRIQLCVHTAPGGQAAAAKSNQQCNSQCNKEPWILPLPRWKEPTYLCDAYL